MMMTMIKRDGNFDRRVHNEQPWIIWKPLIRSTNMHQSTCSSRINVY